MVRFGFGGCVSRLYFFFLRMRLGTTATVHEQ